MRGVLKAIKQILVLILQNMIIHLTETAFLMNTQVSRVVLFLRFIFWDKSLQSSTFCRASRFKLWQWDFLKKLKNYYKKITLKSIK